MTNYSESVIHRIKSLGLELPKDMPKPAGMYEPYIVNRGTGVVAAQVSGYDNPKTLGRVGKEVSEEMGIKAAELAGLFALGRIHQALGGFEKLTTLLHVAGHVSSADDYLDQPKY